MTGPNRDPIGPNFGIPGSSDINRMHDYDDLDISSLSHHHSLGLQAAQASPGDHKHDGKTSQKLGLLVRKSSTSALANCAIGAELKDTGIGDTTFTPVNGGIYIFKYKARVQCSTVPASVDIIMRHDLAPTSPTNTSVPFEAVTIPLNVAGGGGSSFMVCEGYQICPDDLAAGVTFTFAVFYKLVQAPVGGVLSVAQSANSRRQFTITLDGFK
jgi:hypothetical protein